MDFHTGSEPSSRGISCISPSFQLGSARVGSVSGNTSQYLHNTVRNDVLYFSSTLSKCGIAPSKRSPSPYKISYKNKMGLPNVFNYFLYIILDPLMDPSGNLYLTSITLAGRFFWFHVICSTSVTHIVSAMFNFVVLLRGGTDSVHAFHQQWCIARLTHVHNSLVLYGWRITFADTLVEVLLAH